MCTVLLPPGVNPIAVDKYIISYIIFIATFFSIYFIYKLGSSTRRCVLCNTLKCPPSAVGRKQLLESSEPEDGLPHHRPQQFLDIDSAGYDWNQYAVLFTAAKHLRR